MKKKGAILVLGFIVILSGWWVVEIDSRAQPTAGVLDVWTTWVDAPGQLQALLDRYSQVSDMPIRVKTGVKGSPVTKAMAGPFPPDIIVLSSNDLVWSYYEQGLIEPLDAWIEAAGVDVDDLYSAPLAQCRAPDGTTLCLLWGGDVNVLFWNKDLFQAAGLDPERSHTAVVRGPVIVCPSGAKDKTAVASLMAWMTSPEIVAEMALQ
jgi:multiple sugar transport system substrate-binding protein